MSQRQHAKAKLPLGNHCRRVSEIKMDNPLNSLTQNASWKTWTSYRKEKGRHSETQYLVCISKTSLSYNEVFCVSLCMLLVAEKSVCSGRWPGVAKVIFFLFLWPKQLRLQLFLISKTSAFSQLIMEHKTTGKTAASIVWAGVNHVAQKTALWIFPPCNEKNEWEKNSNKCSQED